MENQTQRPLPNATAVLVLGIIAIVGCFCDGLPGLICGIIALVLAGKDLKLYNADPTLYTPGSYSNLKSGRICAIIGVSLSAVCLVVLIIYIFSFGLAILSHPWEFSHSSM
jgi:hypothetical protein